MQCSSIILWFAIWCSHPLPPKCETANCWLTLKPQQCDMFPEWKFPRSGISMLQFTYKAIVVCAPQAPWCNGEHCNLNMDCGGQSSVECFMFHWLVTCASIYVWVARLHDHSKLQLIHHLCVVNIRLGNLLLTHSLLEQTTVAISWQERQWVLFTQWLYLLSVYCLVLLFSFISSAIVRQNIQPPKLMLGFQKSGSIAVLASHRSA